MIVWDHQNWFLSFLGPLFVFFVFFLFFFVTQGLGGILGHFVLKNSKYHTSLISSCLPKISEFDSLWGTSARDGVRIHFYIFRAMTLN